MWLSACCLRVLEVILGCDGLLPLALAAGDAGVMVSEAPEREREATVAEGMERRR